MSSRCELSARAVEIYEVLTAGRRQRPEDEQTLRAVCEVVVANFDAIRSDLRAGRRVPIKG